MAIAKRAPVLAVLFAALCLSPAHAMTRHITVFAASSLARACNDMIAAYGLQSQDHVRGVYGASGTLVEQLEADAPADIFISAHPSWMEALRARGLVRADTIRPLAGNRIVLLGGAGISLPRDLRRALLQVKPRRIGIADPDSVASGRYAMQTLKALNLWDTLKPDLLVAVNDPAASGMVERNELPVAFAYATDASGIPGVHIVAVAPDDLHDPIVYSAALLSDSQPGAAEFFKFLTGPQGGAVLQRYGFLPAPQAAQAPSPR